MPGGRPEKQVVANLACRFCGSLMEILESHGPMKRFAARCPKCRINYNFPNAESFSPVISTALTLPDTSNAVKQPAPPPKPTENPERQGGGLQPFPW